MIHYLGVHADVITSDMIEFICLLSYLFSTVKNGLMGNILDLKGDLMSLTICF